MSQARRSDWLQANERIRRLSPDAFATYEESHEPARRWGAWESFDQATGTGKTDDEILAAPTKKVEALYCRASSAEELLIKFSFMKAAQRDGKAPPVTVFRDRAGAGFGNREPDEPTEWKAYRARWAQFREKQISAGAEAPRASGERTGEQVRATVRNFMALQNIIPNFRERKLLGIGRRAHTLKGVV